MTVERMIELLEIEKECVLRNASGECNRYCAGCDLLQDDTELHEMYTEAIALLKAQEPEALDMPKPDSEIGCWYDITHNYTLEQVVSALKAHEPRVMTLDKVKMLDSDYYYLESIRSPGKELREIVGAYGLTCVTWPSITWARQTMGDSGYGKTWRCWTSRPDQATMEATPWN